MTYPKPRTIEVRVGTRLGQLLKFSGVAEHGAMAREWIQSGLVSVNGELELRRGYQVANGDQIYVGPVNEQLVVKLI